MTSKAGHTAGHIARRMVDKLFEGRKGHGGASVSYLQMRPDDVASVIEGAIELYDAGNETSLTPRQLAERCEKLEEAAKELLSYATLDGLLDKVESGAEHPNDVFSVSLGDLLKLRTAFRLGDGGATSKLTDDEIVELTSREAALGPDKAGGA